ncbi:MAG: hypothetical protein IPO94_04910 [Saprospiraceae bacterium]|nr:hypothetical protein [Saprospiraceae bacterium]
MPAINTLVDFDIASLPPGTYTIYGFHYRINPPASAFVPAPTVGMLLSQIQSAITTGGATGCGSLTTGTTMGMVLDPILINVSTSCFEADGVTPAPTGTFYVIVNSITGGLPQKLGTGTYTITGIPGITSYVFGSGAQRSTAITYVAGSSLSISVTDNSDPDGNTVGGSPSCVDCMVNTSLAHISCDACPTPEADITNGDPANSDG